MRYYDLSLFNSGKQLLSLTSTGFAVAPANTRATFSSLMSNPQGTGLINNPAALNIEFDVPVAPYATAQGFFSLSITGIGVQQIAQGANLNTTPASLYSLSAGMKPGLPLATAAAPYAMLIATGAVFQAYGNWQGVTQSLDLVLQPGADPLTPTGGIQFNWSPQLSLADALTAVLKAAYPSVAGVTTNIISITQSQSSESINAYYETLDQFASAIASGTKAIGIAQGYAGYQGVQITYEPVSNTILVYDMVTPPGKTIVLAFQDLIGQPTWIDIATVSFKTVLRGDINLGDQIQFPAGVQAPYALTTASAAVPGAPASSSSAFQGLFNVTEVHHFANFRQPDAESWATAYTAVTAPTGS